VATAASQKRQQRLIRQLQSASQSLEQWETALTVAAVQSVVAPSKDPSPSALLLAIVNQAKLGITVRLTEMGVSGASRTNGLSKVRVHKRRTAKVSGTSFPSLNDCIEACRACGRVLGEAFREAQKVADAASARILYGSIRALEKQLWLLDPRQAY